jgi:hypothetical protein
MIKSNDLLNPCYPELNKIWFAQRMNHYNRLIKWLVAVNVVAWSAAAYIVVKALSV